MTYNFVFLLFFIIGNSAYANILFKDNFENSKSSKIFTYLSKKYNLVDIVPGAGVKASSGLKVTYEANNEGSRRLVAVIDLDDSVMEASLSYDVMFLDDFQFVKGGKLHGLGPIRPITGGEPMKHDGWSSRVMFKKDGKISTYLYDQTKTGTYGKAKTSGDFGFQKGKFYSITLYTKLNSSPIKSDGEVRLYINGKQVVTEDHIIFWKGNVDDAKINKFLFSTFHGGHDPSWAPTDGHGNFVNTHAVFDNFIVEKGLVVRDRL